MSKFMSSAVVLAGLMFGHSASASVLSLSPGDHSIEGVAIAKAATSTIKDRQNQLGLLGAGLRSKRVAIVNVKVYVAQLFSSDPNSFTRTLDGALNSLDQVHTVALLMTFVRDVEAVKVQTAFADALVANHVDVNNPQVKAFLDAVKSGGDALKSKNLTVVCEKLSDGTEVVTYENNHDQSVSIAGPSGFSHAILSIWLGVPADTGVADLKKALIGG